MINFFSVFNRKDSFYNLCFIETVEDFVKVVVPAMKAGRGISCGECSTAFEEDDLAFVHETGECPHCHIRVTKLLIEG